MSNAAPAIDWADDVKRYAPNADNDVIAGIVSHSLVALKTRDSAVVSFGKTQPVIATPGPEERNRRTVTEVTGFVKGNPTVMNGKYAEINTKYFDFDVYGE